MRSPHVPAEPDTAESHCCVEASFVGFRKCCLYYFNANTRYAVRLFGEMRVIDELAEKEKYWRDSFRDFGYSGADDANLTLLEFVPKSYKFYVGDEMKTGLV